MITYSRAVEQHVLCWLLGSIVVGEPHVTDVA